MTKLGMGYASLQRFSAMLLSSGEVLIVGGDMAGGSTSDRAVLYDPKSGSFHATGSAVPGGNQATLLTDGRVLIIARGLNLYDPSSGAVASVDPCPPAGGLDFEAQTATLLMDGSVLLTEGNPPAAALYDPGTGKCTTTGAPLTLRNSSAAAVLLQDGDVLLVGGAEGTASAQKADPNLAELYSPKTHKFTLTGSSSLNAQYEANPVRLNDGRVLVVRSKWAELYDPKTGKFTPTGTMATIRNDFGTALLADGRVLVTGGVGAWDDSANAYPHFATAELYDPVTGSFTSAGSMVNKRALHKAISLADGRVLITGGVTSWDGTYTPSQLCSELYVP
jgi:hypothetical protein